MAKYKYASGYNKENSAKAVGRGLAISTKQSIEICNFIRNKPLQRAKNMLNNVLNKKEAVPFKRFTATAHKRGHMGSGKYPQKSTKEILNMLESAESNAQFKGLNTGNLTIAHICAHKASSPWHYGRQRRRKMKRTNLEVILEEGSVAKKEENKTKSKKEMPKNELKQSESKKITQPKLSNESKKGVEKKESLKEENKK